MWGLILRNLGPYILTLGFPTLAVLLTTHLGSVILSATTRTVARMVETSIETNWSTIVLWFFIAIFAWFIFTFILVLAFYPWARSQVRHFALTADLKASVSVTLLIFALPVDLLVWLILQGQEEAPEEILPWSIVREEQRLKVCYDNMEIVPFNGYPQPARLDSTLAELVRNHDGKCLGVKWRINKATTEAQCRCGNRVMSRNSQNVAQRYFCHTHIKQAAVHLRSRHYQNWPLALQEALRRPSIARERQMQLT